MEIKKILKSARIELNNFRLGIVNNSKYVTNDEEKFLVKQVQEKGYFVLENVFDAEWCLKVQAEIDRLIKEYNSKIWKDDAESDHRLFGADRVSDLINNYYNDPFIKRILQTYEGTVIKDGFTLGAKLEAKEGNKGSGGGWHRDHPNIKQSKSIVYLTDVNIANGPFQYIEESHKSINVYKDSLNHGYDQFQNRFTDEEVQKLIDKNPDRLKTLTASQGSMIFTDTRGIHRGMPIENGIRYALTNYFWFNSGIPAHFGKHLIK